MALSLHSVTLMRFYGQQLPRSLLPIDVTQFQQDNARPHSARLTTAFLRQQGINTLPWPAFSSDLSPIEHLWDQLGRAVRQGHPQPQTRR
jgi:hypothetical protein